MRKDKQVIKFQNNKTIAIENYLLDLYANKNFSKPYSKIKSQVNSDIREKSQKQNLHTTSDIRKMIIFDFAGHEFSIL